MGDTIIGSQVAKGKSKIKKSKNFFKIKHTCKETMIVSFAVGVVASLVATYIYTTFF